MVVGCGVGGRSPWRCSLPGSALALLAVAACSEPAQQERPDLEAAPEDWASRWGPAVVRPFDRPGCAIFDVQQDAYFLAARGAAEASDTAIVVRIDADTQQVMELRWAMTGDDDVPSSVPSAMALVDDEIWVADGGRVRRFERTSGARRGGDVSLPAGANVTALVGDGRSALLGWSDGQYRGVARVLPGGVVRSLCEANAAAVVALGRGAGGAWCVVEADGRVWTPAAEEAWREPRELRPAGTPVSGAWLDETRLVDVEDGDSGRIRVWAWADGSPRQIAVSPPGLAPRARGLGFDPGRHVLLAPLADRGALRLQPVPDVR